MVFCHSANSSGTNTISDTNTNTWTSVVNNEFYVPGPDSRSLGSAKLQSRFDYGFMHW